MAELITRQKNIEELIEADVVPSGTRIHSLVDGCFKAVGISKVS